MLSVREISDQDIPLLVSYWLESNPDHLVSMGVDLAKLPSEENISNYLKKQNQLPINEKQSYALIWLLNNVPVGHCNVNQIKFGEQSYMHLHLWQGKHRLKGMGSQFVKLSIPLFFEKLQLKTLFCEPYALNPAPSKTLKQIGFEFVKEHITIPGSLNFEQPVLLWKLTKARFSQLIM